MQKSEPLRISVSLEECSLQLEELFIGQVQKYDHGQEWKACLQVNNNIIELKLDTGAQANVIPSDVFNSLQGTPQLKTTETKLTGFSGSEIPVLGVARMICKYRLTLISLLLRLRVNPPYSD